MQTTRHTHMKKAPSQSLPAENHSPLSDCSEAGGCCSSRGEPSYDTDSSLFIVQIRISRTDEAIS